MKTGYLASVAGLAVLAIATFVSAQAVPVTVTNQGSAIAPSANSSGVTLGTFTLVSTQSGGSSITSIPLSLTTGSGGNAADLNGCQIYNSNGSVVASSGIASVASGVNTVSFPTPLQVSGNQSAQFTVRCNVGSNIASGATYQFTAGTPVTTAAGTTTPTSASLRVLFTSASTVRPGAQDANLGVVTLSASNSNSAVQVSSLPVSITFGSGMAANMLSDCRIRNVNDMSSSFTATAPTIIAGSNVFTLDSPLQVPAGNTVFLALTCDVASAAPAGGTLLMSLTPGSIPATVVGSSASVTPMAGTSVNGNAGPTSGSVLISSASAGPIIPGVPNTGFGAAGNMMVLAASGIAIVLGAILLRRRMA